MTIERAGPAHAAAMAAVHEAAFPREAWDAAFIAAQLALPGRFGFAHPQGGMALARLVAEESEILTLAVAPGARRRGVGGALLDALMRQAAEWGAAVMFLEAAAENEAALALYRRRGFAGIGRRPGYYPDGRDALVLRRAL